MITFSSKYKRVTTLGCKVIGIRQFEFAAKTPVLWEEKFSLYIQSVHIILDMGRQNTRIVFEKPRIFLPAFDIFFNFLISPFNLL